jgi:uncharacterized protein with ATP-grasp and redox domains
MRTCLECVPCFLRQALEAGKTAGCDLSTQEQILRRVAAEIPRFDLASPPRLWGSAFIG